MDIDFGEGLPYNDRDLQKYLRDTFSGKELQGYDLLKSEVDDITDLLELSDTSLETTAVEIHKAVEKENELIDYINTHKDALLFHALLGDVLYKKSKFSEAITQYEQYIKKEPQDMKNHLKRVRQVVLKTLVRCQSANKMYAAAERTCIEYLAEYPPNDETMLLLGINQYVQGKYIEAAKNLQFSLQLNPNHVCAVQIMPVIKECECKIAAHREKSIARENSIAFKVCQFFKKLF